MGGINLALHYDNTMESKYLKSETPRDSMKCQTNFKGVLTSSSRFEIKEKQRSSY